MRASTIVRRRSEKAQQFYGRLYVSRRRLQVAAPRPRAGSGSSPIASGPPLQKTAVAATVGAVPLCSQVGAETTTQEKARWHAQVHFCAVFVLVICLSAWVLLLRLCSRFVCLLGCWTCCLPPRAALSSPSRNTSADNQSCLLDCIAALALQHTCSFHS